MQDLSPDEICCLSKTEGRRIDDITYVKACNGVVEKLMEHGYLQAGTHSQSLIHSDMGIIRKLLKDKGQKTGGKKVDLIQRIFQCYSNSELERAEIPTRFILTRAGEQVISRNGALLYYFNAFGSSGILKPEQIISEQNNRPTDDVYDILIGLLKKRISEEESIGIRRVITYMLGTLFSLKHEDALVREAELEVERLDRLWEAEKTHEAERINSMLGISTEEHERSYRKAISEMDDDWEKELDARNRAKAGME